MKVRYDDVYDILYIEVEPKKAHDTQPLDDDILIDLDENGDIVGIEIWNASKNIVEPITAQLARKIGRALKIAKESPSL